MRGARCEVRGASSSLDVIVVVSGSGWVLPARGVQLAWRHRSARAQRRGSERCCAAREASDAARGRVRRVGRQGEGCARRGRRGAVGGPCTNRRRAGGDNGHAAGACDPNKMWRGDSSACAGYGEPKLGARVTHGAVRVSQPLVRTAHEVVVVDAAPRRPVQVPSAIRTGVVGHPWSYLLQRGWTAPALVGQDRTRQRQKNRTSVPETAVTPAAAPDCAHCTRRVKGHWCRF